MKNKPANPLPRRQRRVPSVFQNAPTYFLTFCSADRAKMLANNLIFKHACEFIEAGNTETGFFVSALMIMPDHIHALVSISPQSEQKIGNWVRAFKRAIGKNNIRWQKGFFDHILRSNESRSEKWEYIRNNPVRAELVRKPEEWPYQRWFHPTTGEPCAPDEDVRPTNILSNKPVGPTSLSGEKNKLRNLIAARRPDFQTLEPLSAAVIETFQTLEVFKLARAIGAYMPLADEVDISPLFQGLEKTFFIPSFDEASGLYRMAQLTTELKKGRFGITEPAVPVFAAGNEIDLILVPGVAFDRAGRRIGRGGGFYDRLLPQYDAVRVGVCFDFQCLETIPAEEHDIQMDWLITESSILKIAMNS
ncbi:MAG: 5-formyltetrahydrofolate cyclo-ligase [Verrucomicrobia bacterium]|nr:5-formyltetrahydrofolate cyclo-ligase [Verrucomicrobiota bacterium]